METIVTMSDAPPATIPAERSLLIVEDDKSFLQRLARAMEARGFIVTTAETVADGLLQVEKVAPAFAVVDMQLDASNGLDVIGSDRKPADCRAALAGKFHFVGVIVDVENGSDRPARHTQVLT